MANEMILIVDDELDIGEFVGLYLSKEGYSFRTAVSGEQALRLAETLQPQLILLDVQLPDMDGYELCRQLRAITNSPIVFLTCKDSEMDKVIGFSVGGDDYMNKPFSPVELMARIKAHIRRSRMQSPQPKAAAVSRLESPSLAIDLRSYEVRLNGRLVELSTKEFQLLSYLMNNPKQVLTTEQLLRKVWGYGIETDAKTLQVHIGNLRRKIEDDPSKPERIVTVRGVGYKFHENAEAI